MEKKITDNKKKYGNKEEMLINVEPAQSASAGNIYNRRKKKKKTTATTNDRQQTIVADSR